MVVERGAGEDRHHQAGAEDEQRRDRAEPGEDHEEQRRGEGKASRRFFCSAAP